MLLIHKPAEGDEERYDIDAMSAVEAGAVERVLEERWANVEEQLREGAPSAMLAVLWAFRKRKDASLRFGSVDVPNWRKSLFVRYSTEEVADYVAEIDKAFGDDETKRTMALNELRKAAADSEDVDLALMDDAPKASSKTTGESTPNG